MLPLLFACGSPTPTPSAEPTPPLTPVDTAPPTPTGDTAPPLPVVDCSVGPVLGEGDVLGTPRGYHGLAFDADGRLYGSDNTNLLRSTSSDDTSLFVPNLGVLQQIEFLPDGSLVVARDSSGSIDRIAPDGTRTTLASGIGAYGLTIGPDGFVYTANQTRIHRIDPAGAGAEVFVPTSAIARPKVLTFSREGDVLWVGTISSQGNVWRVDIDTDGQPVLPPTLVGQTGGSWHDAITLDACGNVYVNEYNTSSLYLLRYGADAFEPLIRFNQIGSFFENVYGHGLVWGPDIEPWGATRVYMPLPYFGNRVGELDLGVPGRDFNQGRYEVVR